MAERHQRLLENVPGPYYVDANCIDCDMCRTTASDFFVRKELLGMSVVIRQPTTPEECAIVEEARLDCPTDSIGNDG